MLRPNKEKKSCFHGCLLLGISIVILVVSGCPTENDVETESLYITNPGFEAGLAGWTLGLSVEVDSTLPRTGTNCISLAPEDADASWASQEFDIDIGENTNYSFKAYTRLAGLTGTKGGYLYHKIFFYDAVGNLLASKGGGSRANPYYNDSEIKDILDPNTVRIKITLTNNVGSAVSDDTILVDDLHLVLYIPRP